MGGCVRNHVPWETLPHGLEKVEFLIVGEGPGVSEDVIGRPFIGASGQLLRRALDEAFPEGLPTLALYNLLACRPFEEHSLSQRNRAPAENEILACRKHMHVLVWHLRPRCVVFAGKIPQEYGVQFAFETEIDFQSRFIRHPAYVVRRGPREYEQYVHSLREALT